ncbi:UNVERIFIED_CONTAM: hypothetical protein Slati_3885500 [Sesamum latifolium]|uniref:Uncharacterized protein n=1 Tax=Sesamum latifolium TaxID=2727402 RepID=A0AAW2TQ47_9LAMI
MHPLNAHLDGGSFRQSILAIKAQVPPAIDVINGWFFFPLARIFKFNHTDSSLSAIEAIGKFLLQLFHPSIEPASNHWNLQAVNPWSVRLGVSKGRLRASLDLASDGSLNEFSQLVYEINPIMLLLCGHLCFIMSLDLLSHDMACVDIIYFVDQPSNLSILLLDVLISPSIALVRFASCSSKVYALVTITRATFVVKEWLDTEQGEDGGDLFPSSSLAWLGEPKSFWTYSVRGVI